MSSIASSSTTSEELPTPRALNVSDPMSKSISIPKPISLQSSFSSIPSTSYSSSPIPSSNSNSSSNSSISSTPDLIKEYVTTSPTIRIQNRNSKTTLALSSFLNASPEIAASFNEKQRGILANTLLVDLSGASGWRDQDGVRRDAIWDDATRLLALKALKEVGRLPGGSSAPATEDGLRTLLLQLDFPPPSSPKPISFWYSQPKSSFPQGGFSSMNGHFSHSHSNSISQPPKRIERSSSSTSLGQSNLAFGMETGSGLGMGMNPEYLESNEFHISTSHKNGSSKSKRPSTASSITYNSGGGGKNSNSNSNPITRAFSRRSFSQTNNGIPIKKDSNGNGVSYPPNSSKRISNHSVRIDRNGSIGEVSNSSSSPSLNPLPFEEPREDLQVTSIDSLNGDQSFGSNNSNGIWNKDSNLFSSTSTPIVEGIDPFDNSNLNPKTSNLYSNPNSSSNSFNSSPSLNHQNVSNSSGFVSDSTTDPNSRRPSSSTGIPTSSMKPYLSTLNSKLDWEITDTSLRCLNNALFLNEKSREIFSIKLGGGEAVIDLLRNPLNVTSEILFLAGRLLFFCTLFESPFNKLAVEELGVVGRLVDCLFALASGIRALHKMGSNPGSRRESVQSSSSSVGSNGRINSNLNQGHTSNAGALALGIGMGGGAGSFSSSTNTFVGLNDSSHSQHSRPGVEGTLTQLNSATSELLKALFNLGLYYPRLSSTPSPSSSASTDPNLDRPIVGESFHESLTPLLDPIIRFLIILPLTSPCPLTPPMTNVIAALLNFPVKNHKDSWFGNAFLARKKKVEKPKSAAKFLAGALFGKPFSGSNAAGNGNGKERERERDSTSSPKVGGTNGNFGSSPNNLHGSSSSNNEEEIDSMSEEEDEKSIKISLNLATGEDGAIKVHSTAPPVLKKLLILLDRMCSRYFAISDPDDPAVKKQALLDGIELEEIFQPLILLLRKLSSEDDKIRRYLRMVLLPPEVDREIPLDRRGDTTGRLVRLMSAVLLPQCARAAGELLLALCEGDPSLMTEEFGYGPCAGFLTNNNLASSLPGKKFKNKEKTESRDSNGEIRTINPITGSFNPTSSELANDPINQLSESEKEIEADKLFTLFDRMNKNGVMKVKDPRESLIQNDPSRFQEIEEKIQRDEIESLRKEELEDEELVEKEMKDLRRRKENARERAGKLVRKD